MTEKELYRSIGKEMKRIRKDSGCTQENLSKRIGLSKNHISALENGKHDISCAVLYAYATSFGCSADKILGIAEPKILPHLSSLISDRLSKEQQDVLYNFLDTCLKSNDKQ